jgi:tetratricopeptide (TPR) repeat protein
MRLGTMYREAGNLALARQHYAAARDANPRYAPARVLLGLALLSLGMVDQAIAEWREALAIDPESKTAKMYIRMVEARRNARGESTAKADSTQPDVAPGAPWDPLDDVTPTDVSDVLSSLAAALRASEAAQEGSS